MTDLSGTAWGRMAPATRKSLVWCLWFVTWLGLLAGLFDRAFYEAVVAFSILHAFLVLILVRFRVAALPAQVRIGFVLWVAVGTYVPYMRFLMYVPTLGLIGNLFFNYCLLARMIYLLVWNREEDFSLGLVRRVLLSPPAEGGFKPLPAAPVSSH